MLERHFQSNLIATLKVRYPDCLVLKNDASYIQGIPDLLVLFKNKWAMLECKKSETASHRPNQDYYVRKAKEMSFARYIYPGNSEEVLNELDEFFGIKKGELL